VPCPKVLSGEHFLASALTHIDCQGRTIGAYGWGALADPSSQVSVALMGLLSIFVAIFGIRLILGYPQTSRDTVADVLIVAIALTLATSWPAWRVVGYDLVLQGPSEIASSIGLGSGLPGSAGDLAERLQNVDQGLASLSVFGTGRLGVSQGDWFQLGFARLAFLSGALVPLATVRLGAGSLLALAPLMAGLLLFGITRSLFEGWARALAATFLASIFATLLLSAELAILEPWLLDALQRRVGEQAVLDAPVEALALTMSFGIVSLMSLYLAIRIAFHPALRVSTYGEHVFKQTPTFLQAAPMAQNLVTDAPSRAHIVSNSIAENFRREERMSDSGRRSLEPRATAQGSGALEVRTSGRPVDSALGDSWRRGARRQSGAQRLRDQSR
jgi:type IV secretion system protein VirB6